MVLHCYLAVSCWGLGFPVPSLACLSLDIRIFFVRLPEVSTVVLAPAFLSSSNVGLLVPTREIYNLDCFAVAGVPFSAACSLF